MSVSRKDLIKHLEAHGCRFLREGGRHSIYTNGKRIIPIKRHRTIDNVSANAICRQAGVPPIV